MPTRRRAQTVAMYTVVVFVVTLAVVAARTPQLYTLPRPNHVGHELFKLGQLDPLMTSDAMEFVRSSGRIAERLFDRALFSDAPSYNEDTDIDTEVAADISGSAHIFRVESRKKPSDVPEPSLPHFSILSDSSHEAHVSFLKSSHIFSAINDRSAKVSLSCTNCTGTVIVVVATKDGSAKTGKDYNGIIQIGTWVDANATQLLNLTIPLRRYLNMDRHRQFFVDVALLSASINVGFDINRTSISLLPETFCGFGELLLANRTTYRCRGVNYTVTAHNQSVLLPSDAGTTCDQVKLFFNASEYTTSENQRVNGICRNPPMRSVQVNTTQEVMVNVTVNVTSNGTVTTQVIQELKNVTVSSTVQEPIYANLSRWCSFWDRCYISTNCSLIKESKKLCYCPLDYSGESCDVSAPTTCDVSQTSPPECSPINPGSTATSMGYQWNLMGDPPCVLSTSPQTMMTFGVQCRFESNRIEGPVNASILAAERWEYPTLNLSSRYDILQPDQTFARTKESTKLSLRLKFWNMLRLSDASQIYMVDLPMARSGFAPLTIAVNTSAMVRSRGFVNGGRMFGEARVWNAEDTLKSHPKRVFIEQAGYQEPPFESNELGSGLVALIVIMCLLVIVACGLGCWWKRRKESKSSGQALLGAGERSKQRSAPILVHDYDEQGLQG